MESSEYIARRLAESEGVAEAYGRVPKVLFKYKALSDDPDDFVYDILENHHIYMPTLDQLNDPFEGAYSRLVGFKEEDWEAWDALRRRRRILALSREAFGRTLWGNYADNSRGVCIGFRTHPALDEAEPVRYLERRAAWAADVEASLWNDFLIKHADWSSEREWRVLRDSEDDVFLDFGADDIACVLCGCAMKPGLQSEIRRRAPKSARIFRMAADVERLGFVAECVDAPGVRAGDTAAMIDLLGV